MPVGKIFFYLYLTRSFTTFLSGNKHIKMKVSVVGVGHVGATLAYTLMIKDLADELALIDRSEVKAQSDAEDLKHALTFTDHIIPIKGGDLSISADSDIVIITASVPWKDHYTSRYDLCPGNDDLFKTMLPAIARLSPAAIVIVVTNPVDVMTYLAIRYSGFQPHKVLGVGTLIDSARFRKALSEKYLIHPDDIRAYIIGEHGATQFPVISAAFTGGVKIQPSSEINRLIEHSEIVAHEIVKGKGYTNFAIAMATSLIVQSIIKDENRTMPVSTLVNGYMDVEDVCLSVPVVVGREGIRQQLHIALDANETTSFRKSALKVREELNKLIK